MTLLRTRSWISCACLCFLCYLPCNMGKARRSLPFLIKKSCGSDASGPARAGRCAQVDDGPVRQFGCLARVRAIGIVAKIDAAVEQHVPLAIERVGKNENRRVAGGVISLALEAQFFFGPTQRKRLENDRQQFVGPWVAPQHEIVGADLIAADVNIILNRNIASENSAPHIRRARELILGPSADFLME